ncbi:hypothetical protein A8B82_10195 [Sulfitobacter sp. EhC04]|uniref:hypothetical protein n=1 Tax=Sulfitobacter sp. EhC04 TaxID=1849168 RepID=UPI0007F42D6C|nr:hypothetical protein [Sulfitobacter sp. EhC04]OAN78118.1 hypothetical protein A8B82_10195 [Sulfitobacter sp. EhC04]
MPERRMFLERRSYRMRRAMDALRLWPLVGLALWMVPLLWAVPGEGPGEGTGAPMPMSSALRYIFGVWVLLILGALALWWRTGRGAAEDSAEGGADSPPRQG